MIFIAPDNAPLCPHYPTAPMGPWDSGDIAGIKCHDLISDGWMRRPTGRGFNPCRGRQHSFLEIDHEIFSTVILSLPLKGSCQFLAKKCAQYWLTV